MSGKVNVIAAVGLALGGALGMAGAMVTQQNVQAILWAIDGAGLVMATALLAMKYFRMGNDIVAGGFLVFAIGEGVILLSGPAAGLAGSVPAFAAGTAQPCLPTCRSTFAIRRICKPSPRREDRPALSREQSLSATSIGGERRIRYRRAPSRSFRRKARSERV
jgi:hypothetical protein